MQQDDKQWGLTEHISGNATKIVQFPLAYTTFSHWVANSRSSSTNESSWCTGGYNGTLTGFTARSNGTEIEWIATGLQQWGRYTSESTITLPISYSSQNYIVTKTLWDCTYGKQFGASYLSVIRVTASKFDNPYPGVIGDGGYYYVSVGF